MRILLHTPKVVAAAIACLMLAPMLPVLTQNADAQDVKLADALAGHAFPLTLTLKDLQGDWRRMTISGQGDMTGWMMAGTEMEEVSGSVFYTRGQAVTMGGATYLVAYRPQVKAMDMSKMMRGGGMPTAPATLTPDTPLGLSLLDLRTVGNLTNIQPFNMEQEIATRTAALKSFQRQMNMPQPDNPKTAAADDPSINNLSEIGIALAQYIKDHADTLPPLKDPVKMKKALEPYTHNTVIFTQPGTQESYRVNPVLSEQLQETFPNSGETVVFYEAKPAADGTRGVLFLDGQARRIQETEWPHFKKISKLP